MRGLAARGTDRTCGTHVIDGDANVSWHLPATRQAPLLPVEHRKMCAGIQGAHHAHTQRHTRPEQTHSLQTDALERLFCGPHWIKGLFSDLVRYYDVFIKYESFDLTGY